MTFEVVANNSEILAIHAAILPTNQILMFGGSEHNQAQNQSGNPADLDNTWLSNLWGGPGSMIHLLERTRRRKSPQSRSRPGVSRSLHRKRPVTAGGFPGDGDGELRACARPRRRWQDPD